MRKKIIAGNWKMYKTPSQAALYVHNLANALTEAHISREQRPEILICPPFVGISVVAEANTVHKLGFKVGAQNVHWEDEGAYTGEISVPMLADMEVDYIIVGHSERRQYFHESDGDIAKKLQAIWRHGLKAVLCVGETLETRERAEHEQWVSNQLRNALENATHSNWDNLVVAYEPIWAIGTGKNAEAQDATVMAKTIRKTISGLGGPADQIAVLYGGSVNPGNIEDFMAAEGIDGALVGGACLKTETFVPIIKAAAT